MGIRRVVTGHTPDKKATVVDDSIVEQYYGFSVIWGADETLTFPDEGLPPSYTKFYPPAGGFRFTFTTIYPQSKTAPDPEKQKVFLTSLEEKFPGILSHHEKDNPGMHTTDTVDCGYIISGEIWVELDDGEEVLLKAGDTFIQSGTRHALRNKGTEPCHAIGFMVGANRK